MHAFVVGSISLAAGLIVGTIYGRKVEQKIVGVLLADYAAAGRIPQAALSSLQVRLAYLKKYVAAKI